MAHLLYVVGNEMEVARLDIDTMNKDKEGLCIKMEHIKVVHESVTTMKEEEAKKLHVLQQLDEANGAVFYLQLVTLDFYKKWFANKMKPLLIWWLYKRKT